MKLKNNKKILVVYIAFTLTFIDQVIKQCIVNNLYNDQKNLITGFINLTYVENTGGAFGIGKNSVLLFIIVNIIIIGLLIKLLLTKKGETISAFVLSISLIISGGLGNLIDRVFRGYVIDYIDINPLFRYPIFNFADICVVIGVGILIIDLIINKDKS